MTFAHLSQATAESQRYDHRTQNTFNRIIDTFMTIEIHDQGKFTYQMPPMYVFIKLIHHSVGRSQYQQ